MSAEEILSGLKAGDEIAHYRILECLGRGGMGEVLLAEDQKLGRQVAIKVLPPEFGEDSERLERFQREARTVAAISHPNIVTIYAVEECEGFRFLSMEVIRGETLREKTPAAGMRIEDFFEIAVPLAAALSAAHAGGITHRDLKPENVMVSDSGIVKVLDFGLAKVNADSSVKLLSDAGSSKSLTMEGCLMGTLPYMSPEQARGEGVDQRTDIFSLGIVYFEMLCGQRPFEGETVAELLSSILRDEPPSLVGMRTDLPPGLEDVIRRCLKKDRAERFSSAEELLKALEILQERLQSHPDRGYTAPVSGVSGAEKSSGVRVFRREGFLFHTRIGLFLIGAAVFALNFLETTIENGLSRPFPGGAELQIQLAAAASWLERGLRFVHHDAVGPVAVYGCSISYFFLFPVLLAFVGLAFLLRPRLEPFRVLVFSIALNYGISLPFFLFFPMLERWAFPDSGAILLSDLWSSRLIEAIRPISGLDNCFPSAHTSLTVTIIVLAFLYELRGRWMLSFLGASVILSTVMLGIHWIPDLLSGASVALVSVALARRLNSRLMSVRVQAPASSAMAKTGAPSPRPRLSGCDRTRAAGDVATSHLIRMIK